MADLRSFGSGGRAFDRRPMRPRRAICEGSSPGDPSFDGGPGRVDDRSTKARCPEIEATLPGPRAKQDPRSRPRGSTCPSSMAGIEGSLSGHRAFGVRLSKLRCSGAPLSAPAAHARRLDLRALEARRSSLSRTIDEGSKSSQPTCKVDSPGLGRLGIEPSVSGPDLEIRSDATRWFGRARLRSWQFSGNSRVRGVVGVHRGPVGGAHV